MAPSNNARISRVHGSWRVRVPGYDPMFFADSNWDGKVGSLSAARIWRDRHWDGRDRSRKLSDIQRRSIQRSKEHYLVVAKKHNISPNYVHQIRREK